VTTVPCSGQMIAVGTPNHHACIECGHRTGSHALQADGIATCDICAVLDELTPTLAHLLDEVAPLQGLMRRHLGGAST